MTVQEYRHRLEKAMEGCSPDEIENAVEYYTELIEESEDPDAQMESLGTPEELAERIKRESGWMTPADGIPADGQTPPPQGFGGQAQNFGGQQAYQQTPNSSGAMAGRIVALVLTFPFWIALFSILISLFFVIWGVYISFPCGAISALAAGIMEMKTYPGYGLIILLTSILFAGLAVLLAKPAANLTRLTAHGISRFAKFLFAPNASVGEFVWKKMSKVALIAGIGLTAVGLVTTGAAYGLIHPTPEKYAEKLDLVTKEYELTADHSDVVADMDIGNIVIKKSEDGKAALKASNIKEEYLTVKDESTLSLVYKSEKDGSDSFNFDLFGMKTKAKTDVKFELYLPEKEYNSFKIEANLGRINISDMTATAVKLNADCGEIKASGITADNIEIKDSLGKVSLSNITADGLNVEADCGAVEMNNVTVGDLLDAKLSLGAAKFENMNVGTLKAECDCGDFKYNGIVTVSGNIQVDLGAVKMTLSGQDYNVHADADTGSVSVDDSLKSGSVLIEVNDDCGSISVKAA